MTATFKPFKSAALGYHAVHTYLRDNAPPSSPKTIEQIYEAVKDDVKNLQQVRDAVTTFRNKGYISSMREGRAIVIWYKNGTVTSEFNTEVTQPETSMTKTEVIKPAILTQPNVSVETKPSDLPEVQITKDRINILAGGVKISIERY
jgi:hypothetical protein